MSCPHSHLVQVLDNLFRCVDCGVGIEILQAREVSSDYALAALMLSLPAANPRLYGEIAPILDKYFGEEESEEEELGEDEAEVEEEEEEPAPPLKSGPALGVSGNTLGDVLRSHGIDPAALSAEDLAEALRRAGFAEHLIDIVVAAKNKQLMSEKTAAAPVSTKPVSPAPKPTAEALSAVRAPGAPVGQKRKKSGGKAKRRK